MNDAMAAFQSAKKRLAAVKKNPTEASAAAKEKAVVNQDPQKTRRRRAIAQAVEAKAIGMEILNAQTSRAARWRPTSQRLEASSERTMSIGSSCRNKEMGQKHSEDMLGQTQSKMIRLLRQVRAHKEHRQQDQFLSHRFRCMRRLRQGRKQRKKRRPRKRRARRSQRQRQKLKANFKDHQSR